MAKIGVVGAGYVGLTSAVCFAELGHDVIALDVDAKKITQLQNGSIPIYEPGLEDLLNKNIQNKKIYFEIEVSKLNDCDYVFLCVPTPQDTDGAADLSYVLKAVRTLSKILKKNSILVTKSTVPVNSWKSIELTLNRVDVDIVSNPEFLREGSAISDFFNPDRIVVGCKNIDSAIKVAKLYKNELAEVISTDNTSAELIKYASNSFLALKLSFVNELAALCENVQANVIDVLRGFGKDQRIGEHFISPGPGWGGSCFPKDVKALNIISEQNLSAMSLLSATIESNQKTLKRMVDKIERILDNNLVEKKIALLGLAFKANTDDVRESPAVAIAERLSDRGAKVCAFDPKVKTLVNEKIIIAKDLDECISDSEIIVLLTEWHEFKDINPETISNKLKNKVIFDTRNLLNKDLWEKSGFLFFGNGR
ncbi:MAG: UDP-glucose dehydrogenase family protein [Candidatus Nanopelagicales bacterium]